jgi:hypothetical protein
VSPGLEEISVIGQISTSLGRHSVITDDGDEYQLSAIAPWEAVAPDYDSQRFAQYVGKRVHVCGLTDGSTIWRASLDELGSSEI